MYLTLYTYVLCIHVYVYVGRAAGDAKHPGDFHRQSILIPSSGAWMAASRRSFLHVCVYNTYIYIHICMHRHMCMYVYVRVYVHVHYVCIYICMYTEPWIFETNTWRYIF